MLGIDLLSHIRARVPIAGAFIGMRLDQEIRPNGIFGE
jgi:hypothetical protein